MPFGMSGHGTLLSFYVILDDLPVGGGFGDGEAREPAAQVLCQHGAHRILCGEVARVDQADALPLPRLKLVVAEVRGHEHVAPCGDGRILIVAAGAAAHRDLPHRAAVPGVADAVGLERPADVLCKFL